MVVRSKVSTQEFTKRYVLLWNGYFKLSPKQVTVLVHIVENGGLDNTVIKFIKDKYKLNHQAWYHFKGKLMKSGALLEDGSVNPRLIPRKQVTFKFDVYNEVDSDIRRDREPSAERSREVAEVEAGSS